MPQYIRKPAAWVGRHKFWSAFILIVVLGGGWYAYAASTKTTTTSYTLGNAASSTVVATLSESGTVAATSEIDVQAKASGEVLHVYATAGQHVGAGAAIAQIDPTTAQKAVRDAQNSLASAQLALDKLVQPSSTSTLINNQNAVASAQAALTNAHESSYNDISSAFLDLPGVVATLDTTLHGQTVSGRTYEQNENAYSDTVQSYDSSVIQYMNAAEQSYQTAYATYQSALADFKATPRDASDADITKLLTESYQAAANVSDALKATSNFLNFVNTTLTNRKLTIPAVLAPQITAITNATNSANQHVVALTGDSNSVASALRSVSSAEATLEETQAGADPLDIQSSQLSVAKAEAALADAEQSLADTTVRAPFSGTIGTVSVDQYQTIGSGNTVASMVSDGMAADLSLSESDVGSLKVGQKAILTFDALPDVTIAGTVAAVSGAGTASGGVVSYTATVSFDTPNTQVKPGMSVTADIITGRATGIAVPSSAVKTSGNSSYVLAFDPPLPSPALANNSTASQVTSTLTPSRIPVTTGLSSDTETIITSGLVEGQQYVVKSTTSTAAAKTTTTTTSARGFGGPGAGAAVRIGG